MRRALSLIELLVVMAIIAILVGLLLPAVQKIRNAAAKSKCQSNLRQIGLALHTYQDAQGFFPNGCYGQVGLYPFSGWSAAITPYLEQQSQWNNLLQAYSLSSDPFVSPPHVGIGVKLTVFICPSDPRLGSSPEFLYFNPQTQQSTSHQAGFLSYLAISGQDRFNLDGMLYPGSQIAISDVTDGTSNTLLVGERPPSSDLRYGWWYAGTGDDGNGTGDFFVGVREIKPARQRASMCSPNPNHFVSDTFSDPCSYLHFWSSHASGAPFLLVDGSVQFLWYTGDSLFPALASRNGGELVALFE